MEQLLFNVKSAGHNNKSHIQSFRIYIINHQEGSICDESPLFKQHYLWQYVQLLHNRLLYRCTSI